MLSQLATLKVTSSYESSLTTNREADALTGTNDAGFEFSGYHDDAEATPPDVSSTCHLNYKCRSILRCTRPSHAVFKTHSATTQADEIGNEKILDTAKA